MATAEKFVGGGVLRKEDPKLVTGQATFVESIALPGMLHAAVVRSPFGSARIEAVDLSVARTSHGVVAAFSGEDLANEWVTGLPMAWPVTEDIRIPDHWPVTKDVARYAGDAVAVSNSSMSITKSSRPWLISRERSPTVHRACMNRWRATSATRGRTSTAMSMPRLPTQIS